jgi:hypothetical protein
MSIMQGNYLRLERRGKTWWFVEYDPAGHTPVDDSGRGYPSRAKAVVAGCVHLGSSEARIFDLHNGEVKHHEKYDLLREHRAQLLADGQSIGHLPAVPPKRTAPR